MKRNGGRCFIVQKISRNYTLNYTVTGEKFSVELNVTQNLILKIKGVKVSRFLSDKITVFFLMNFIYSIEMYFVRE